MTLPIGLFVEPEGQFAGRGVGDDGLGAPILQPLAQLCAIVGLVAEQPLGWLGTTDQSRGRRTIMGLATGQQEGKKTAFSICECVDLRVAPAARAANRLFLGPLFRPQPSGGP